MRRDSVALGVALVSIVLNVVLIVDRPTASVASSPQSYEARIERLTQDLEILRSKINRVDHRIAFVGATTTNTPTQPDSIEPPVAGDPPRPEEPKQPFVQFHSPSSAVQVSQTLTGTMSVENTDPALTGTTITINADYASGKSELIEVVVPAPKH